MLRALRPYGHSRPHLCSLRGATFGSVLSETLPEGKFDDQPLTDDRLLFVADARLDNREELASELEVRSPTLPDANLLLRAWMRWREASFDRIVGDFALAVFEQANRTLTLARDATGQRPLFFIRSPHLIAFASMPSALSAVHPCRFRMDRLAATHAGTIDTTEITNFQDVIRVLPGHFATIDTAGYRQTRYWNPPNIGLELSDEQYRLAYREQLDRAVASKLRRRSGGLGVHLSSGWDSSAVTAAAAGLGEKPIAFTAAPLAGFEGRVPRGRVGDEFSLAALTARMHHLRHEVVRPEGTLLGELREHSRIYQEPGRNIVNMQWWSAVHRAARELGVTTMLTGQLGNLSLHSAGLWVLAEWVRRGDLQTWFQQARAAAHQPGTRWRGVLVNSFREWLPDGVEDRLDRIFRNAPAGTETGFVRRDWLAAARFYSQACARPLSRRPYAARLRWIEEQDVGVFRLGALAETGIDERDPMADRRLLDFSFALPPEQLIWNGARRPLARRALADRLPREVLDAPLRGYQGADWYRRVEVPQALAIVEELGASPAASDLLDLDKMQRAIRSWPAQGTHDPRVRVVYRNRLLGALSTGVFLQEFEAVARQRRS
jgi:asparagine synthase (glutamine-hydrolysing)